MTYIIKRRDIDSRKNLYLACHDTPWGWWQSSLSLAVRFVLKDAATKRLLETRQPGARIVRLRPNTASTPSEATVSGAGWHAIHEKDRERLNSMLRERAEALDGIVTRNIRIANLEARVEELKKDKSHIHGLLDKALAKRDEYDATIARMRPVVDAAVVHIKRGLPFGQSLAGIVHTYDTTKSDGEPTTR